MTVESSIVATGESADGQIDKRGGINAAAARMQESDVEPSPLLVFTPPTDQRWRWVEPTLVVGLFALALIVRLVGLWKSPPISDEGGETLYALRMLRDSRFSIEGPWLYMGPLFSYLLVGSYSLFGESETVPRVISAIIGAAAIPAAYFVGRELYGKVAGTIGAGLMISNALIVVLNRTPYTSNLAVAPFLLGLYGLLRFLRNGSIGSAALAGFGFGLAVHAHPAGLFSLVGVLIWLVAFRTRSLRTKGAGVAALVAVAVNGLFLVTIARYGLGTVIDVITKRREGYSGNQDYTLDVFRDRAWALSSLLFRGPGGSWFSFGGFSSWTGLVDYSRDHLALALYALWAISALVWSIWRRELLPIVVVVPACLILFAANINLEHVEFRFVLPAFTLVYVAMGGLLAEGCRRLMAFVSTDGEERRPALRLAVGAALVAVVAFATVIQPYDRVRSTDNSYADLTDAQTWARYLGGQVAVRYAQPGDMIHIDGNLSYRPAVAFTMRLTFEEIGYTGSKQLDGPGLYVVAPDGDLAELLTANGAELLCCEGTTVKPAPESPDWGKGAKGMTVYRWDGVMSVPSPMTATTSLKAIPA